MNRRGPASDVYLPVLLPNGIKTQFPKQSKSGMQYHSSPLPFYLVILKIYIIRYIIYGECQDVTDFLAQLISTPHVADAVYQAFLSQCTSRPAVRASSDFARYFHRWTRDCRRDTSVVQPHRVRHFEAFYDVLMGVLDAPEHPADRA